MRYGIPLAFTSLIACCGVLQAQEVIPAPPPDPIPPGLPGLPLAPQPNKPPSADPPPIPLPPGASSSPGTSGPTLPSQVPPGGWYGPPPGMYGPYGPYGPPPPGMYTGMPPSVYGPPPPLGYSGRPMFMRGDPANNPNVWMDFETLIWWAKGQPLSVPVVTTGPGSEGANAGGIGVPGTVSLNRPLNYGAAGGVRFTLGGWFTPSHTWGIEGDLFTLGQQTAGFSVNDNSGSGNFVINEPVQGAPFATQVSAPGVETGGVIVHSTSEFWGTGINGLFNLVRQDRWTVTLLGGFRFLELNEHVDIVSNSALFTTTTYTDNMGNTLATAPPGSTVTVIDQFSARNQFYGGQLGLRFQYVVGRWSVNGTGTFAIGATHETVTVNGSTNVFPTNSSPVFLNGGNFATIQSGLYSVNRFAVAPGLQLNLGYQFTPFIRGTIGYNFLFLSNVIRPGNQIDNTYDGTVHPLVPLRSSTYWTQGLNLGLQISF